MKTVSATFAVLCVFCSVTYAEKESSVQEDYVWQERFEQRMAAARSGDAEAQFSVGEMYEKGSGVPIDLKRAFTWYERASKQNHQKSQFKLAYMYYRGEGTDSNPGKAFLMMERLAKSGYVRAQYYLGLMYETGVVTTRNIDQAYAWYRRAADGGYTPASDALADLAKSAPEVQPLDTEAHIAAEAHVAAPAKPTVPRASKPATPKSADFAAVKPPKTPAPPVAVASTPATTALLGETARGATPGPNVEIGKPAPPLSVTDPAMATIASMQPAIQVLPTTFSLLLNGNWMSQSNLPVEFLPSKVTNCERSGNADIECLSKEIVSNVANSEVVYQTRATVSAIQPSGEFKVKYKNNVVKIQRDLNPTNPSDPSQTGMGITLGWQQTEHHLDCKLEAGQTVHCIKNQTQKLTLKNQTEL